MKARLFRAGDPDTEPFEFGESVTIGRGEANTLRLEPVAVSTDHARIYFDAERGRYVLEDLGSLNGTRLDGVRIVRPEPLDRLHVVRFGAADAELVFQALDLSPPAAEVEAAPEATAPSGTAVEREMPPLPAHLAADADAAEAAPPLDRTSTDRRMPPPPPDLLAEIDARETLPVPVEDAPAEEPSPPRQPVGGDAPYYLHFNEPPGALPVALAPGVRVLGRARSADISVASASVSRRHALLTIGEGVTVRDLGSRNHTFVNDERIEDEVEVRPGARLRFGALTATLLAGGGPE